MILYDELCSHRCAEAQTERSIPIQIFIAELSHSLSRIAAVALEKIDRVLLRYQRELRCVVAVHLVHDIHVTSTTDLPVATDLRQLDLDRIDAGYVMHDNSNCSAIGDFRLPLVVSESFGVRSQTPSSLLYPAGKCFCSFAHFIISVIG